MSIPQTIPYDRIANEYDALVQQGHLIHHIVLPPLLGFLGEVRGQRVADVACGTGVVARALAVRGAEVVGVDLSENMLALARQYEAADPLGIQYLQDDARHLACLADASFDAVVCCLAITDIPDMENTAGAISRILRPGGCFVWAVPHPCFQAPGSSWYQTDEARTVALVQGYFNEGFWSSETQFSGRFGGYHRRLSTLLNLFTSTGLRYECAEEPQAFLSHKPGYSQVPVAFIACCRKDGTSHGKRA